MYIYIITNIINNKIYIGKTVNKNLFDYLSVKRWAVNHNKDINMPIIKAMQKYGMDNFIYEILDDTASSNEELIYLEKEWIAFLDSMNPAIGYNATAGGEGASRPCSEATKKKIGLANRGRKPKGYIHTAEHCEQIRQRMLGSKHGKGRGIGHFVSDSEKEKHRQSALKQWQNNPPRIRKAG